MSFCCSCCCCCCYCLRQCSVLCSWICSTWYSVHFDIVAKQLENYSPSTLLLQMCVNVHKSVLFTCINGCFSSGIQLTFIPFRLAFVSFFYYFIEQACHEHAYTTANDLPLPFCNWPPRKQNETLRNKQNMKLTNQTLNYAGNSVQTYLARACNDLRM